MDKITASTLPGNNERKVSIIIPVFNMVDYTKQCCKAIVENTPEALYEVIIVDNASTDGTKEFFKCLGGDVHVIRNEKNLGFAKACNQGAKAAKGTYLLFLNNDTVPQEGWLDAMVETIEEKPKAGIVGSKLLYPDGTIQHAGVVFYRESSVISHIYKGLKADHRNVDYMRDFNAVTGACLLIPKKLFFDLQGFYEGFIAGYEDVDLCLRTKEKGLRVIYQPKSVLIHHEEVTRKTMPTCNTNDGNLLLQRNVFPDDGEEKTREDGFTTRLYENGQMAYYPINTPVA